MVDGNVNLNGNNSNNDNNNIIDNNIHLVNNNGMSPELSFNNKIYFMAQQHHLIYSDKLIKQFNQQIGPNLSFIPNEDTSHKDLLILIDKRLKEKFI